MIPAKSAVARSVYALSTDPHARIEVDVAEVNGAPGGALKTNGLTGFVIFNTDSSAPNLIDPDNNSAGSVTTVEIYNPNVSNPNVSNPNVSNPNVSNPNVSNPNVSNPNVSNPNVSNPNVSNPDLANPNVSNPNVSNPNVSNPNVSNPNVSNPNVSNPNVSNAPVSDATYTVTNTGNTASTYRIQLVGTAPTDTPLQLIITKPYTNPASLNCVLFEQQHNIPVANVVNPEFLSPNSPPAPGITDPSDGNATFVLGPGESILVTIRAPVDVPTLTNIIQNVAPVVVAHAPNTNDATNQPATSPPAITTLALPDGVSGQAYSASITALGGRPPYTWTATGLPANLSISGTTTGVISGTPSAAGTFSAGVSVKDSASKTGSHTYTLHVVASSGPTVLTFTVQPTNAIGGQPMPSVTVQALDGTASPVPGASITIAPGTIPCSAAILTGPTTAMTDATGVATFPGLSIDRGGWGYTLTASVTGNASINVASNTFNVAGFCATGSPSIARYNTTLTTLADGRVLLVGGNDSGTAILNTAETYDPATRLFTPTNGTLSVARFGHAAALLPDGTVLIVGGTSTAGVTTVAELFDPVSGTFSSTAGGLGTGRVWATATWVPSAGNVLIAGGQTSTGYTTSFETYDPSTKTFTSIGGVTMTRAYHSAAPLPDGHIFIAGGQDSTGNSLTSAGLWDPSTSTFTLTGSLTAARSSFGAVTLSDGRVLIAGGHLESNFVNVSSLASAEIFNPSTGTFSAAGTMGSQQDSPAVAALPSGKILVCGGRGAQATSLFDPLTSTFTPTGLLINQYFGSYAAPLPNGLVLIAGGGPTAELFYPTPATVFMVTTTADTGAGSLRQAILDANAHPGLDAIHFNIPGAGVHTISPASALPAISDAVLLDATTQPGHAGVPLIRLDGVSLSGTVNGLEILAGNSTVTEFMVTRFPGQGIQVTQATATRLIGNFVGTDGSAPLGNGVGGIRLSGSSMSVVDRNVVSANNGHGIDLVQGLDLVSTSDGNSVLNNRVGVDPGGAVALGNAGIGVYLDHASRNTLRGNVISGNEVGLWLVQSLHNRLTSNRIGTNSAGTAALANSGGIGMFDASDSVIGGSAPEDRNVISGNAGFGIYLAGNSTNNVISGNRLGTDAAGSVAIPNTGDGINLQSPAHDNRIGGATAGAGNLISGNGGNGISLGGTVTGNLIVGNFIGTNATGTAPVGNTWEGITLQNGALGNTISDNVIAGNQYDGIFLSNVSLNVIQRNWVGTNSALDAGLGNHHRGIWIFSCTNSTIGGTTPGDGNVVAGSGQEGIVIEQSPASIQITGNVISGNSGPGINVFDSQGATISGNKIGTTPGGTVPWSNAGSGIALNSPTTTGITIAGNLVSGNLGYGIVVYDATGNAITANQIGTDLNGALRIPNQFGGVLITAPSQNNTVGGIGVGAGNVVAGNSGSGVILQGTGNTVQGNWIGTNPALAPGLGNAEDGVYISGDGNLVGGTAAGAFNVITSNAYQGVLVSAGSGNAILSNSIARNVMGGLVVNPGANAGVGAPVLTSAVDDGTKTVVTGTAYLGTPAPGVTLFVQFFSNAGCAHPPLGEGEAFLQTVSAVTDVAGIASFTANLPTGLLGKVITATTNTLLGAGGNTSALSACAVAGPGALITEYPVSTSSFGIAAGPDGALWFTGYSGNSIGRLTTGGALSTFPVPTASAGPYIIAVGSDGALWFTEEQNGNNIGRITTTGAITEFAIPTADGQPYGIAAGPDGALWFTEAQALKIGRITTSGSITEFGPISGQPYHIVAGPDGALWFTVYNASKIGRITTSGVITEFVTPTANSGPHGIAAGPDDALWFTEALGNKIGKITTAGTISEFPIPTAGSRPPLITAGPDGALWFTEFDASRIGRVTTSGAITEFSIPTTNSGPYGIAAGPDGALWFTEYNVWKIGRLK